jgi:hypothetical protein
MSDQTGFDLLRLETDTSVSDWAIAGAGEWHTVACVVPAVFPDYARLFHPGWRSSESLEHEVRWSEVARANGRTMHAAMEWASITGSWRYHWGGETQPGVWDRAPEEGSLSQRQVAELAIVLGRHTSTPDECFFAIWEGFGDLTAQFVEAPKLSMPNRNMVIFRGPLSSATASFDPDGYRYRSPSLWWPADRAWCVGTDVDIRSSYVGASSACVNELTHDPELEAMRVTAKQSLTADTDQINPEPAGEYPYG